MQAKRLEDKTDSVAVATSTWQRSPFILPSIFVLLPFVSYMFIYISLALIAFPLTLFFFNKCFPDCNDVEMKFIFLPFIMAFVTSMLLMYASLALFPFALARLFYLCAAKFF